MIEQKEKRVQYLELIYDLIFVYIVGRNNSLLHTYQGGFVALPSFYAFILCSLAVIQIWNYSTFYTNMHGKNGLRDHIFMFVNMYLLFYVAEGTRVHWNNFAIQYHAAWALILINIAVHYILEKKNQENNPGAVKLINGLLIALFGEAALILIDIPVYLLTKQTIVGVAIVYGLLVTVFTAGRVKGVTVDFGHLAERAMLYTVLTFGEMIIVLAFYFKGEFEFSTIYFATMCFFIIVGLFSCYEIMYNFILDKERKSGSVIYMLIHIFLIFSLNLLTASLEFMKDEYIRLIPKLLLLIGSYVLFFTCLFLLILFAKGKAGRSKRFFISYGVSSAAFIVSMILTRELMYVNIAINVLYVFLIVFLLYRYRGYKEVDGIALQSIKEKI